MLKGLLTFALPLGLLLFTASCLFMPRASVLCEGHPIAVGFPLVFYDDCAYNLRTGLAGAMLADLLCAIAAATLLYTLLKLVFDFRPRWWFRFTLCALAGCATLWITGWFMFIKWS
jgi:hypothetical protein